MLMIRKRTVRLIIALLWAGSLTVITVFSLLPPSQVTIPGGIGDKWAHLLAYSSQGFFTFAMALVYRVPRRAGRGLRFVYAVLFCLFVGVGIELLQPLTGRSMELLDIAADAAGAVLGAGAASYFFGRFTNFRG